MGILSFEAFLHCLDEITSIRRWRKQPALRVGLRLESLEARETPAQISVPTGGIDIPLPDGKAGTTVKIRLNLTTDSADQNDPSEGEGFVTMDINSGSYSKHIASYGIQTFDVPLTGKGQKLHAVLNPPPNSDGDEGDGFIEVLPTAKVSVGKPDDTSDNIALFNDGSTKHAFKQSVGVTITNQGSDPATFSLEVKGGGGGKIDPSVSLAAGASKTLMFEANKDSSAANDVQILAKYDGATVGEDDLTVVSVDYQDDIYNPDTPAQMVAGKAYRITPGFNHGDFNPTSVDVTVTPDLRGSNQHVTLVVDNQDGNHGTVSIDGKGANTSYDLTSSEAIKLNGVDQTKQSVNPTFDANGEVSNVAAMSGGNPNALQLHLVTRVGADDKAHETIKSGGFGVSAIPRNFSDAFIQSVDSGIGGARVMGIRVQDGWESDSAAGKAGVGDLDLAAISEVVDYQPPQGVFKYGPGHSNSGYLMANGFTKDKHTYPVQSIINAILTKKANTGSQDALQTSEFLDFRMGVAAIPMQNSGMIISRWVYRTGQNLYIVTEKSAAAVAAHGIASGPASVSPSPIRQAQFIGVIPAGFARGRVGGMRDERTADDTTAVVPLLKPNPLDPRLIDPALLAGAGLPADANWLDANDHEIPRPLTTNADIDALRAPEWGFLGPG